jgi:hypothetical protein
MTREKAIERLKELQTGGDPEIEHAKGDEILVLLLESLGYADVVQEWHRIPCKWYA